jgi:hypothetical protein
MLHPFAVALLLVATTALAADAPPTASGVFRSQAVTLRVNSAVTFRSKSFFDDSHALIVAISNVRMYADAIADYVDHRRVIERRVMDGQTAIVSLEVRPDGTYRGMSYYFLQGNGCAFCTGEVASTVTLVDGELAGKLTDTEKDRSIDLVLATPIMTDEHGAALPADGGEPGRAYMKYHDALARGDRAARRPLLSNDRQQFLNEAEKNGTLSATLHTMADAHPAK